MSRPTRLYIDTTALLHNVQRVKQCAPGKKIIAMVKANAYGCGLASIVPRLDGHVHAFGVACLEEAMMIHALNVQHTCVLFQGVFNSNEYRIAAEHSFACVIHTQQQLAWLLLNPLPFPLSVWIKIDTGMHRLGLLPAECPNILSALRSCAWVDKIGIMSHFACADEPSNVYNQHQWEAFTPLTLNDNIEYSMANSAAILAHSYAHLDVVRPGIMLYGVSPFAEQSAAQWDLKPVMQLSSVVSAIHHYPANVSVGYGCSWYTDRASIVGVVPIGYGDGYPRHIEPDTPVLVNGYRVPIVGRVSMDMMTIDLTDCPSVGVGDPVELWGEHLPVEVIARAAHTIGYELLCQISSRVRRG